VKKEVIPYGEPQTRNTNEHIALKTVAYKRIIGLKRMICERCNKKISPEEDYDNGQKCNNCVKILEMKNRMMVK